jgi:hypothetical protein
MILAKAPNERLQFTKGLHKGKYLEDVAKEDPSYLTWAYVGEVYFDLPDEMFHAVQDVMTKFKIPFEKPKRRSHRTTRRVAS